MNTKKVFEFWLTKPDGEKMNEFISTYHGENEDDIKKLISSKFDIDVDKCTDFKLKSFD